MADLHHAKRAEPELPLVTIMIPTYGQERVVLEAVDSALAQDYPNLEVIVADDASPDNTAVIISARRDNRLRYHRNPVNLGRVANYRNTLYNLANGDWVVNLDGDDYFTDTGFVSAAITLASREPGILVVMGMASILGSKHERNAVHMSREDIVPGTQLLYEIAYRKRRFFHFATLYRRREALLCGFYRMNTLSSDLESICRLSMQGKIGFLNRNAGFWRVTKSSATQTNEWEQLLADLQVWPAILKEAVTRGMPSACAKGVQSRIIANYAYGNLSQLLMSGECSAAGKYLCHFLARYGIGAAVLLATRWRLYIKALSHCLREVSE